MHSWAYEGNRTFKKATVIVVTWLLISVQYFIFIINLGDSLSQATDKSFQLNSFLCAHASSNFSVPFTDCIFAWMCRENYKQELLIKLFSFDQPYSRTILILLSGRLHQKQLREELENVTRSVFRERSFNNSKTSICLTPFIPNFLETSGDSFLRPT